MMASLINSAPASQGNAPHARISLLNGDPNNQLPGSPTAADAWDYNTQAANKWLADQRASGVADGLIDPKTGWPTQKALVDAAQQYGSSLIAGTAAPGGKMAPMDAVQHMLDQIKSDPKAKWGIRITPEPLSGDLPPSRVWADGDPTDKLLPGTSVVGISGKNRAAVEAALKLAGIAPYGKPWAYYPGQHVTLVKGEGWRTGYDDGEKLMTGARAISSYQKADDGPSHLLPMPDKDVGQ